MGPHFRLCAILLLMAAGSGCKTAAHLEVEGGHGWVDNEDDTAAEEDARAAAKETRGGLLFGPSSDAARLAWPVDGDVSSRFGKRGRRMHRGIDIRANKGTTVRAAASGKVTFVGRKRGYGKTIVISHKGFTTLYAHLSEFNTRLGSFVDAGDPIAAVGATGNASGAHLHFEKRMRGEVAVDPLPYLPAAGLISGL